MLLHLNDLEVKQTKTGTRLMGLKESQGPREHFYLQD